MYQQYEFGDIMKENNLFTVHWKHRKVPIKKREAHHFPA